MVYSNLCQNSLCKWPTDFTGR